MQAHTWKVWMNGLEQNVAKGRKEEASFCYAGRFAGVGFSSKFGILDCKAFELHSYLIVRGLRESELIALKTLVHGRARIMKLKPRQRRKRVSGTESGTEIHTEGRGRPI